MNDSYKKGYLAKRKLFLITAFCCIAGSIVLYTSLRSRTHKHTEQNAHISDEYMTLCDYVHNNDAYIKETERLNEHTQKTQKFHETHNTDAEHSPHIQHNENEENNDKHKSEHIPEDIYAHIPSNNEDCVKVYDNHSSVLRAYIKNQSHICITHNKKEKVTLNEYVHKLKCAQTPSHTYSNYRAVDKSVFLESSYTKLQQALVHIYNIERRIHMGTLIDDDTIAQYKRASIIVFEHVLYDHKIHLHNNRILKTSVNVFDYKHSLKRAVNTYILTVIKNARHELGDIYRFVEEAHKDLYAIHNTIIRVHNDKNAPYARLGPSVIRIVPSEQYDETLNMSHTVLLFHSATFAEIYNNKTHVHDMCIYLNIGKVLHKHSVVNVIYNEKIYANIRYMPMNTECLRTCLLPYFMNYSIHTHDTYMLIGYTLSISLSPQHMANIYTEHNMNVCEIYDNTLTQTQLSEACITYVCGNIQQIEKFSDFKTASRLLKKDIYDVNNLKYMYETFKGYMNMTVCTQYTKEHYTKSYASFSRYPKIHIYSSFIKLSDTLLNETHNEHNIPQNIPFGSVVIKTCLEIIESYFNLIVNSEHMTHTKLEHNDDEIYRTMYMFIDVSEENMYDAHKYDIRNAYTKVMGCVFHVLHTHKEHILHTLIQSYKSVDKEHFVKAYEYLQSLKVIIVQTDSNESTKSVRYIDSLKTYAYMSELFAMHSQYRQHIYDIRHFIPFHNEHTLEDIVYMSLLSPDYALARIMSIQNDTSVIHKIQKRIYRIMCNYMEDAPFIRLFKKYRLRELEYEGKREGTDIMRMPVCRYASRKYDFALNALHAKIQSTIEKYKLQIHYEAIEPAFKALCMTLNKIETQYDAKKLLRSLVNMTDVSDKGGVEADRIMRLSNHIMYPHTYNLFVI